EQLETIRDIWEEGKIGPTPKGRGPDLLVGGSSGEALARMARYGDGYMHGGGPPRAFAGAAAKALAAWSDLGRPGRPTLWGMGYFALGDGTLLRTAGQEGQHRRRSAGCGTQSTGCHLRLGGGLLRGDAGCPARRGL